MWKCFQIFVNFEHFSLVTRMVDLQLRICTLDALTHPNSNIYYRGYYSQKLINRKPTGLKQRNIPLSKWPSWWGSFTENISEKKLKNVQTHQEKWWTDNFRNMERRHFRQGFCQPGWRFQQTLGFSLSVFNIVFLLGKILI